MLDDPDIKQLVYQTLAKAASSCCHNQSEWYDNTGVH
jgi:hypothetical protein